MGNVMTNAGRAIQTNLVSGLGGIAPKWLAIGSGSTTAAVTDTALTTEYTTGTWTGYARFVTTPTRTTTSVTNDTITWSGSWTAGAAQTVAEAGNFDQLAVGGNMLIHGNFTGVALNSGDSITINITNQYN